MESRTAFVVAGGGGRVVSSPAASSSLSSQHQTGKESPKFYSVSSQRATAKARRRRWREATAPLTAADYQRVAENLESSPERNEEEKQYQRPAASTPRPAQQQKSEGLQRNPEPHQHHVDPEHNRQRINNNNSLSPLSHHVPPVSSPPLRTSVIRVGEGVPILPLQQVPHHHLHRSHDDDDDDDDDDVDTHSHVTSSVSQPPSHAAIFVQPQQRTHQYDQRHNDTMSSPHRKENDMSPSPARSVSPRAQKHRMILDDTTHYYRVYSPPRPRPADADAQNRSDEDDVGGDDDGPDKSTQKGRSPPPLPRSRPPPRVNSGTTLNQSGGNGSASVVTTTTTAADDARKAGTRLNLDDDEEEITTVTVVAPSQRTPAATVAENVHDDRQFSTSTDSKAPKEEERVGYNNAFSTPPEGQLLQFMVPSSPSSASAAAGGGAAGATTAVGAGPNAHYVFSSSAASPTHSAMFAGSITTMTRGGGSDEEGDGGREDYDMTARTNTSMFDDSLTSAAMSQHHQRHHHGSNNNRRGQFHNNPLATTPTDSLAGGGGGGVDVSGNSTPPMAGVGSFSQNRLHPQQYHNAQQHVLYAPTNGSIDYRHQRQGTTTTAAVVVGNVAGGELEDGASNWSPEFLSPVQRPPSLMLSPDHEAARRQNRQQNNRQLSQQEQHQSNRDDTDDSPASPPPLLVGVGVTVDGAHSHAAPRVSPVEAAATTSSSSEVRHQLLSQQSSPQLAGSPIIVPMDVLNSPQHIASRPEIEKEPLYDDDDHHDAQSSQHSHNVREQHHVTRHENIFSSFTTMVSVTLGSDDDDDMSPLKFHRDATSIASSPHLREGRMSVGSLTTQDLLLRQDDDRRAQREVDKSIQDVAEAERLALEEGGDTGGGGGQGGRAEETTQQSISSGRSQSHRPMPVPQQEDKEERSTSVQPAGQGSGGAVFVPSPKSPPQLVSVYVTGSGRKSASPPTSPKQSAFFSQQEQRGHNRPASPPPSMESVILPSTSLIPPLSPPLPQRVAPPQSPPSPASLDQHLVVDHHAAGAGPTLTVSPPALSRPLPQGASLSSSPSSPDDTSLSVQSRHTTTTIITTTLQADEVAIVSPPRSRPLPTSPPLAATGSSTVVGGSPQRQRPMPSSSLTMPPPPPPSTTEPRSGNANDHMQFTSPPRQRPLPSRSSTTQDPPRRSSSPPPPSHQPQHHSTTLDSPPRTRPLPSVPRIDEGDNEEHAQGGDAYSPSDDGRGHHPPLLLTTTAHDDARRTQSPPRGGGGSGGATAEQHSATSPLRSGSPPMNGSSSRPLPSIRPLPSDLSNGLAEAATTVVAPPQPSAPETPLSATVTSPPRPLPFGGGGATTSSSFTTTTTTARPLQHAVSSMTEGSPLVSSPKRRPEDGEVPAFTASMNLVRRAKVVPIPVALREYVDAGNTYLTKLKLSRNKLPATSLDAVRDVLAFATSFGKASTKLKETIASSSLLRQTKLKKHHPWVDAVTAEGDEAMYSRLLELIDDEIKQVESQVARATEDRASVCAIEQLLQEHKSLFANGSAPLPQALLQAVDVSSLLQAVSSSAARSGVAAACTGLVKEMSNVIAKEAVATLTATINKCRREEVAVSLLCDLHRIYPCGFVPHDASTRKSISSVVSFLISNNSSLLTEGSAFSIPDDGNDDAAAPNSPTMLKAHQDRAWALRDALVDFEESATLSLQASPPKVARGSHHTGGAPLAQRLSFVAQATSQVQHLQEGSDAAKLVKLCADSHRYCAQSVANFQSVHENPGYVSILEATLDSTSALLSLIDNYTVQLEAFVPKRQLLGRWELLVKSHMESIVSALTLHAQGEAEEEDEDASKRSSKQQPQKQQQQQQQQQDSKRSRRFFIDDEASTTADSGDADDADAKDVHDALYHKHRHPQARLFDVLVHSLHRNIQNLDDTIAQRRHFLQRRQHMRTLLHEEVEMVKHLVQIPLHLEPTALVWEGVTTGGGTGNADDRLELIELVVGMNQQLSRANFLLIGNGLLGKGNTSAATPTSGMSNAEMEARQQDVLASLQSVHETQEVIAAALRRYEQDTAKAAAKQSDPMVAASSSPASQQHQLQFTSSRGGTTLEAAPHKQPPPPQQQLVSLFGTDRHAPRPMPQAKAVAVLSKMKGLLANGIVVFLPNVVSSRRIQLHGAQQQQRITARATMQLTPDATALHFHSFREAAAVADHHDTNEQLQFEGVQNIAFKSLEMILQGPSVPLGPTTLQCVRFLPDEQQHQQQAWGGGGAAEEERHVYFPSFASFMEWSDVLQVLLQGRNCLPSAELLRQLRESK